MTTESYPQNKEEIKRPGLFKTGIALLGISIGSMVIGQGAEVVGCDGSIDAQGEIYNPDCQGDIEGVSGVIHDVSKPLTLASAIAGVGLVAISLRKEEEQ